MKDVWWRRWADYDNIYCNDDDNNCDDDNNDDKDGHDYDDDNDVNDGDDYESPQFIRHMCQAISLEIE